VFAPASVELPCKVSETDGPAITLPAPCANEALVATVMLEPSIRPFKASDPAFTVVGPVYVLLPPRVSVAVPDLVRPPEPAMPTPPSV